MMSAKLATPALLKRKKFQNKGYDAIILDFDINKEILSCNSNYTDDDLCDQSLATLAFLQ